MAEKGLVHVYTGEGKGKTTAALGLSIRAAGSGKRVVFVQFFKEDEADSGEKEFLRRFECGIELIRSNCRHPIFLKGKADDSKIREAVQKTFDAALKTVEEVKANLLVLDEAMAAINGGWLGIEKVLGFLDSRPEGLEVVLTGRSTPVELVKAADYVTEMLKIKHPFDLGIGARKGVEY